MPNAKVLSEKQAIVEALAERIKASESGLLIDYKGITVAQDTALRAEFRKEEVEYTVIKNTLARFALDKVGLEGLDSVLNGTTSFASTTKDPIAPFRIVKNFTDNKDNEGVLTVKAAYMDGKILDESEIAQMSSLPSKDALYSQVFGTMLAPITSLAVVLNQIAEKLGGGAAEPAAE